MHESGIWLLNKELQICIYISPRRTCTLCGFTMKISSRGQRHFIYNVKRNTKRDGMGPFNEATKPSIYLLGRYKNKHTVDAPEIHLRGRLFDSWGWAMVFCEKKRLFIKFLKINSLFSYLWEKNSLFMKR